MSVFNVTGGGSNPLNFKVIASAETPESTSRNLIVYPYYQTTLTNNGVTFTDNGDGTVTASGTASNLARFRPAHKVSPGLLWLEPGTYTASGCPAGGDADGYRFEVWDNDNDVRVVNDTGSGATFTLTSGTHVRFSLLVAEGLTVSNLVFKPQLEKGDTATDFVLYAYKTNTIWVESGTPLPTNVPGYAWEMRIDGVPDWETYAGCVVFSYNSSYTGQVRNDTTAAFDIYAAMNPKRQIHALLTGCYQNQDGTTTGWGRMNAYIYKSGCWVQFSAEFAASIIVTFPEGSTCTCSDGNTTLTAPDTSGSYTFVVPNTGTWTVNCTNGDDTATDTVEITADGQSESVELSYSLIIFENGAFTKGSYTGTGTSESSYSRTEISGTTWLTVVDYNRTYYSYTTEKFDLTKVNTLYVKAWTSIGGSPSSPAKAVGVSSAQNDFSNWAVTSWLSGDTTLDVSKLSGEYYFCVYTGFADSGAGKNVQVGISYIGSEDI